MKAKVTGVSAWQGTPTGGTLSIRMPRYVDSSGNATVEEYAGWLDVTHNPPRWMDGIDHTRELYIIVQGPDDPPGPRASFYEVLEYGAGKAVRTPFSRKLISSDLAGLIFDYAAPEADTLPSDFGDAPLTMRAAQQLLDDGTQVIEQVAESLTASEQDRAATIAATEDARAVVDAVRGDALYLRGEVPGGLRLYSLDPDRIRANSVTLRAAGTAITTSAVRVRFTQ